LSLAQGDAEKLLVEHAPAMVPNRTYAQRFIRSRNTVILLFNVAFIALVTSINSDFLRWQNFLEIIENMALPAIVMAATVFLLGAGRFDLSIDGVAALAGITAGTVMTHSSLGVVGGLATGLGVGLVVGVLNGVFIETLGFNPLVTTLASWWITAGIAVGAAGGTSVFGFPSSFDALGQTRVGGTLISTWYAIVVCLIASTILAFTKFGAHVLATGGDREAARLNGVKVRRIGIWLYTTSALAAALAGVIFAARLDGAGPAPYNGLALTVIAAAVIGGASIHGGRGSVVGGLLGLLLLEMLGNATIYVGISLFWQQAIAGAVLLVAIAADAWRDRAGNSALLRSWTTLVRAGQLQE
jgi:ribose transport system permease protein